MTQSGLEEALLATYTKILSPEGSISETAHIRQNAADPLEGCSALPTGAGGSGTQSAIGLVNENFKRKVEGGAFFRLFYFFSSMGTHSLPRHFGYTRQN